MFEKFQKIVPKIWKFGCSSFISSPDRTSKNIEAFLYDPLLIMVIKNGGGGGLGGVSRHVLLFIYL